MIGLRHVNLQLCRKFVSSDCGEWKAFAPPPPPPPAFLPTPPPQVLTFPRPLATVAVTRKFHNKQYTTQVNPGESILATGIRQLAHIPHSGSPLTGVFSRPRRPTFQSANTLRVVAQIPRHNHLPISRMAALLPEKLQTCWKRTAIIWKNINLLRRPAIKTVNPLRPLLVRKCKCTC